MRRATLWISILTLLCVALLPALATSTKEAPATTTLQNLMSAHGEETAENLTYTAYAQKADEEGYSKLASLFRAAAQTEGIHARRYAGLIRKLNGTPSDTAKARDIKTTRENLDAILKDHARENGVKYVDFIKQAEAAGHKDVADAFREERAAEAPYDALYKEAHGNLAAWKTGKMDFFLCSKCGWASTSKPIKPCPCGHAATQFTKAN
jgi:rubrerythrin